MKERHKHTTKPVDIGGKEKNSEEPKSNYDDHNTKVSDIENAHASGIGALGRSDENQIEKLNDDEAGDDGNVY